MNIYRDVADKVTAALSALTDDGTLPRDLDLETATLVVEPIGGWLDCAVYISVVDNITGDAVFLTSQLKDPDGAMSAADRSSRDPEWLGALIRGDKQ